MPKLRMLSRAAGFFVLAASVAGCLGGKPGMPAMPPPKVTVVKPVTFPVQGYFEYNGYLRPVHAVEIKARVRGMLEEVKFVEGEEVAKGKPLFTIDKREYRTAEAKAKADLAKAEADIGNWQAQIRLADAELTRAKKASLSGASAQTDLDKTQATLDINKAQLKVAEATRDAAAASLHTAEIQLGYTDIHAPIAGRIGRTMVDPGNLVGQSETTLLTTIVSMDPLYVYFDTPEEDVVKYQHDLLIKNMPEHTSRRGPVEIGVATEIGYPHKGFIDFRENMVDTKTGTVALRGRIPNPQVPPNNTRLLYPGLFARVRVPSAEPEPRLVVPEEALLTGQEGRYVLVVGPNNTVEKRVVTLGPPVWKLPPANAPKTPPWTLVNPKPAPPPPAPAEGAKGAKGGPPQAPPPSLLSVIAIEKGLKPDDRVIVYGLQKARPGMPVDPDEWAFSPPANADKK